MVLLILTAAAALAPVIVIRAGPPGSVVDQMSTQERLNQPSWWPTRLLATRKDFVGSEACAPCHASIVTTAKNSEMAKALLRPQDSFVIQKYDGQTFHVDGFPYQLKQTPQGHAFTVSRGSQSITQPITWAFGDGTLSQVYLTDTHGNWTESHFSYFGGAHSFGRTTNQPRQAESVAEAVGRTVPPAEIRRCFSCHSAGVTTDGGFRTLFPEWPARPVMGREPTTLPP